MLRILLFSMSAAVLLGYLTGGRLGNLANTRFRWGWVALAGVALQFVPTTGAIGNLVLMLSYVLLFVVAGVNRRLPGFALILVGLWMNFLVISVNEGMPVMREALVASGQADTLYELQRQDGPKHHLATDGDQLTFLSDVIGIGPPIRQAVSVGDLAAVAGIMWFVIAAMQRRLDLVTEAPRAKERSTADRPSGRVAEVTET